MKKQRQNLSKFSQLSLKFKPGSSNSAEVISDRLSTSPPSVKVSKIEDNFLGAVDSPYKGFLHNNVQIDLNNFEEHDFKSPKHKRSKSDCTLINARNKTATNNFSKKPAKMRQTQLTKKFITGLNGLDVNPEHLQLAIALSESEQDQLNTTKDAALDFTKSTVNQTLERFGFTSHRKLQWQSPSIITKRKKISQYKYLTPTLLLLRADTDRQQLISENVALILGENQSFTTANKIQQKCDITVFSDKLKKCWCKHADIFNKNGMDFTCLDTSDIFYVKHLIPVSENNLKCGSLLKDWRLIPGRPSSPFPSKNSMCDSSLKTDDKSSNLYNSTCLHITRSDSPDLFDSDNESPILKRASIITEIPQQNFGEGCTQEDNDTTIIINDCTNNENVSPNYSSISTHRECESPEILKFDISNECIPIKNDTSGIGNHDCSPKEYSQTDPNRSTIESSRCNTINICTEEECNVTPININNNPPFISLPESIKSSSINGIFTFESFADNEQELAQKCIDLDNIRDFKDDFISEPDLSDIHNKSVVHFEKNRSSALNVTDYIYAILNDQSETTHDQNKIAQNNDVETCKLNKEFLWNIPQNDIVELSDDDEVSVPIENLKSSCKMLSSTPCNPSSRHSFDSDRDEPGCSVHAATITPKSKVIIKTTNVTPTVNYDEMSTPKIQKELLRFGLKPFKRRKGVQLLQHIYEMTHPVGTQMETVSDDDDAQLSKRRKYENSAGKKRSFRKHKSEPSIKHSYSAKENGLKVDMEVLTEETITDLMPTSYMRKEKVELVGDNVEVKFEDLIFETVKSKKYLSCRIPFHIVFNNLLLANPKLQESILLYEPIVLGDLYKSIQELGYRFNIKDIENFLHNKCITVKMNNGPHLLRNRKTSSKKISKHE